MDKNELKNELWKLYCKRDKEFEKAKGKRTTITILSFSFAYFIIFYLNGKPTGFDIVRIFIICVIFSVIHVAINATVFGYLAQKGREETEILESIKKKLSELE